MKLVAPNTVVVDPSILNIRGVLLEYSLLDLNELLIAKGLALVRLQKFHLFEMTGVQTLVGCMINYCLWRSLLDLEFLA